MTGVAIPETAEELEERLHDDARMGEIFTEGKLAEFNRAYMTKALAKATAGLVPQMRNEMQVGWQEFIRDQESKGFRPANGSGWNPAMGGAGWSGWAATSLSLASRTARSFGSAWPSQ